MELNELYRTLLQNKTEVDSILHAIEETSEAPSIAIQQRLSFLISEFSKHLDSLREESNRISDQKSRGMWTVRVSRFQEDLGVIQISCDRRLGLLFKTQREKEDRDFLFGDTKKGANGNAQNQLLTEGRSINSSHNMMDTITDQSRAVLDHLIGQNTILKGARGKMYDLINRAGAGSTLASSINTREKVDSLIVYGCMILTILIFLLLWWFVKR